MCQSWVYKIVLGKDDKFCIWYNHKHTKQALVKEGIHGEYTYIHKLTCCWDKRANTPNLQEEKFILPHIFHGFSSWWDGGMSRQHGGGKLFTACGQEEEKGDAGDETPCSHPVSVICHFQTTPPLYLRLL